MIRETFEETGLKTKFLGLVDYWFGPIENRGRLLSLDFVLATESEEVILSGEHTEFVWATLEDLREGRPDLGTDPWCYALAHFEEALRTAEAILARPSPFPKC